MNRLIAIITVSLLAMFSAAAMLRSGGYGAPPQGTIAAIGTPAAAHPTHAALSGSSAAGDGGLTVRRDGSGQFHLGAVVNGTDASFLVDTGADLVAIGESEADRLGIHYDAASFQPTLQTASGTGYGTHVTIDQLSVGDTEFRDVDAVVVQGLETNLLGQSVLRRLGRVELAGDRMVIHPN